jgi:hypothetical protein
MKSYLLITLILVVLLAAFLLRLPDKPVPFNDPKTVKEKSLKGESQTKPTDTDVKSKSQVASLLPLKTMTAIEYKIDPIALNREKENPPFEFRGGAGTGRVIDQQGRVLLESSDERGIFGASVSPDQKKVLVDAANSTGGNCVVLEPGANRIIKLPARPPSSNMFSLAWHWISPNLLFGISGVEKVFHEGPHENCCNDNNVAQTKFYTFDLLTEQLAEVAMPSAVTQPVVNVLEVMSDGHIHLQNENPQEGVEPADLGWFKIDAEK